MIQAQLMEQEAFKENQRKIERLHARNVYETLKPSEINGLKLDKKIQAQLYTGLTQQVYRSKDGSPTNQLQFLLDKYQYSSEANYPLVAEALWLLSDPEGYKSQLQKQGKNQAVEQTVRQLKTEQARKNVSPQQEDDEPRMRKIARPNNIFKR